jgi:fused signal recognition particle receptor
MFWRRKPEEEAVVPEEETPAPEIHPETPGPPSEVLSPLARAAAFKPLFAESEAEVEEAFEQGLERTRGGFMARLRGALAGGPDGPSWEDVEETLIAGDVGAALSMEVVENARRRRDPAGPEAAIRAELAGMLVSRDGLHWEPRPGAVGQPAVLLIVGVNGTGKTTTIGKLAWHLHRELGRTVVLGAGDTYRAAAVEQLTEWAARAGCEIVTGPPGSDPGSVAFEAVRQGRERGADVIIVDTAGRLHTQDDLMAELAKVRRVIAKQLPDAPHETLLTVDATTGQNGLRQAQLFSETVPVDGIVLTKLDGTAKGGIALAIAGELGIPVKLIGIGEALEDLRPFDADDFASALLAP